MSLLLIISENKGCYYVFYFCEQFLVKSCVDYISLTDTHWHYYHMRSRTVLASSEQQLTTEVSRRHNSSTWNPLLSVKLVSWRIVETCRAAGAAERRWKHVIITRWRQTTIDTNVRACHRRSERQEDSRAGWLVGGSGGVARPDPRGTSTPPRQSFVEPRTPAIAPSLSSDRPTHWTSSERD